MPTGENIFPLLVQFERNLKFAWGFGFVSTRGIGRYFPHPKVNLVSNGSLLFKVPRISCMRGPPASEQTPLRRLAVPSHAPEGTSAIATLTQSRW